MEYLFSESGSRRLEAFLRPGILYAFDFDGTLCPLVARPDEAVLPSDVSALLQALARRAPVGIVTGRSVADARRRLGFEPHFLIGNHGMEGVPGRTASEAEYQRLCHAWAASLRAALSDTDGFDPGIELEDKRLSLSVHYRLTADPSEMEDRLRRLFDTLSPVPRIVGGKFVFNLVPEGAPDKGSALEALLCATAAPGAMYVGDDVTDEDVFRLKRRDILSIHIGQSAQSAADYFLDDQAEILRLLVFLNERFAHQ
jgi:trehalose 6-phosphate phosphatase